MGYIGNKPAQGLFDTQNIKDGGVQTADIANSAVTESKIADGSIQTAKLANGAVTAAKIADVGYLVAADIVGKMNTSGGTFTGNVGFGDNDKAIFGAGSDLQIYHNGSSSRIEDSGTGNLEIRGDNLLLRSYTGGEAFFRGFTNGQVDLFYDGSAKLATTSTGIDVTGTVTADGLTLQSSEDVIGWASGNGIINAALGNLYLRSSPSYSVFIGDTSANRFQLDGGTGDISFYEDTGTTAKLFWDASTEILDLSTGLTVGSPTNPTSSKAIVKVADSASPIQAFEVTNRVNADFVFKVESNIVTGGSTIARPIAFMTNNTERLRIDSSGTTFGTRYQNFTGSSDPWFKGTDAGGIETSFIKKDGSAFFSGNVGIGTTSPDRNLHIAGNAAYAKFDDTVGGDTFTIGSNANGFIVYDDDAASYRMVIDSSGNVGIGATSPNANYKVTISGASGGVVPGFLLEDTANNTYSIYSADGALQFRDLTGGSERMRIDSSGRLLLGTSTNTDNYRLQVDSAVNSVAQFTRYAADGADVVIGSSRGTVGSKTALNINDIAGQISFKAYQGTAFSPIASINAVCEAAPASGDTPGILVFSTTADGASSPTERMRIDSSGDISFRDSLANEAFYWDATNARLGIGTGSSPSNALTVDRDTGTNPAVYINNSGGGSNEGVALKVQATGRGAAVGDASIFSVHNNSSEIFTVRNDGNVGIGTDSPTRPLDIINDSATAYTSSNLPSQFRIFNNNTTNGVSSGIVLGIGSSGTTYTTIEAVRVDGSNNNLTFKTEGSGSLEERMRIDSSGKLNINNPSSTSGRVNIQFSPASEIGLDIRGTNTGGTFDAIRFLDGGSSDCGSININADANTTAYTTSSDYRLKENVVDMTGAIDRLKQLPVRRFNFITDPDNPVDGFLAHEAQEIVPESVIGEKDAMRTEEYEVTPAVLDEDGNVVTEAVMGTREVPDYQGIDQSKLVPLLTGALQEAIARIETLEAQVATLQGN